MATIFGIDEEENFGLINKMTQVLTNTKKKDLIGYSHPDILGKTEVNRMNLMNKNENDTFMPLNLSNIEINKSSNENFLSTERGRTVFEKKLQVLKGIYNL